MIHAFHGCELDEGLFQLRRGDEIVKLEPRAFDVLLYLLRHRDRVIEKDELLAQVWPNTAVTESVLPTSIAAIRRAVGEGRERGKVIQTVHGRGYRFVAAVEERPAAAQSRPPPPPASTFVGREPAMQRLRDGLASALAGRGATPGTPGSRWIRGTHGARPGRASSRRAMLLARSPGRRWRCPTRPLHAGYTGQRERYGAGHGPCFPSRIDSHP